MMRVIPQSFFAALLVSLLFCVQPVSSQPNPTVFEVVAPTVRLSPVERQNLTAVRRGVPFSESVFVKIRPELLATAATLDVPLSSGGTVSLQRSGPLPVVSSGRRSFEWKGSTERSKGIFVGIRDRVFGTIFSDQGIFQIRPLSNATGLHIVVRVQPERLPPEHPPEQVNIVPPVVLSPGQLRDNNDVNVYPLSILIAYTYEAERNAPYLEHLAKESVALMEESYQSSGVRIRPAIVGFVRSDVRESQDFIADVGRFRSDPRLIAARKKSGANIVVVIVSNQSFCGYASQILTNARNAFASVQYGCSSANLSFAHEVGHLQGARHNIEVDSKSVPFPYGHGYLDIAKRRRSLMAYDCAESCMRLPEWSRPPAFGSVATANNARVLNETAIHMSKLRSP